MVGFVSGIGQAVATPACSLSQEGEWKNEK